MSTGTEIAAAVARGVAFLEGSQLASGELPVLAWTRSQEAAPDPSVFPTALAAHCLAFCDAAARVRARACDFLEAEMDRHGLWKHWTRAHPQQRALPPDLDDTSCASAALARAGRSFPGNAPILLGNCRRDGLVRTWFIPRLRGGAAHRRATARQLRHLPALFLFFRATSAAPGDVDAVANANALFYLGRSAATEPVAAWLLDILRAGREAQCDKWYENPFAIWYFVSRALPGEPLVADRVASRTPSDALEAALAACALLNAGRRPPGALIERLLAAQLPSGGWPRAALYHGGRRRRSRWRFDPPHADTPHWGSEALTTAFVIEALTHPGEGRRR